MKINGQSVDAPSEEVLYLPRGSKVIEFRAVAIPDFEEFDKLVPEPKPPGKRTKEGYIPNPQDPGYQQIMANHNLQREGYMVVRSLAPSNIEWDIVQPDNPATWSKWRADLKAAGFNFAEVSRILNLVLSANCLDEAKIARARDAFQQGKAAESEDTTSQSSEPVNTPSGEPAAA
jgi:hypothetical protein